MTETITKPATTPYRIENPEEFAHNIMRFFEEGGRALSELLERPDAKISPFSAASEVNEATKTLTDIARVWLNDPARLAEAQGTLVSSYLELWNNAIRRLLGEKVAPVAEPEPSDNRFKDSEWSSNPYFDFWKQAYLLTTHWAEDVLQQTEGLDEHERHKAEFYLRQLSSALSPSNFPMTNPEVVRETFATNAKNLVQGMAHLAHDMEKSGDLLKISQTDTTAFEVGKNLATTPGKVVFENDVFQLIQYTPTTDKVREVPLLVIPPWINKYYILDLTPPKSLLKYAVDQGFTVFVISWVNPDERLSHKTFEDYMLEGILTAADAVKRETGVEKSNVVGYCVGGTLLGSTLAYLAARGEEPFRAVTFLTTQLDFSKAGDLLLFTNDDQLTSLQEMMSERGFLDGSRMANVFNMMRPRDLIWPYIVNNYLLGKKPFPFDLLYWNQDSTRMAAANHAFYLREFYNENKLAKGEMSLAGVKLDLKKIKLPVFEVATKEDHIAPAKSVFIGSKLLGGPVEFVLAGSGHIAGVVNPPDKMKYQYWTANKAAADTLEEWIGMAKEHPGSWWPYWMEWLNKHSGGWTIPREPGEKLGPIEDAPGSYVRTKS
ncbi:class I poly(R)-hydroxyalkanoic acid synthase [Hyphomicrobium sp. LHD-15]|uniref:PHA/PHB synthase family protein n=1 Tax=Hyphomicrobium sp. LHD-15 TaxID=3072142 RepID=UPI00280CFBE0|nr:class I poly(R)-hydroxyalkanoic acid synthase [Hyphomicrobium sp. LHD-15]MDQ8700235.1 class I poly(R)-hydroxyalkanoic acid synthase [Hyphomicrobium sp. LHD-15]